MPAKPKSGWNTARNWVVGLTGVLLVVPALINAGSDIYVAYNKLPRTETEKANVELFEKYFGKEPVARLPLPIKDGAVTYEVKFSVYDGGDVFVEYGEMTQWFPFPKRNANATAGLSPIPSAVAQDLSQLYGPYRQFDSIEGVMLIRTRHYASGATEQQIIDMRSGQIVNYNVTPRRSPLRPWRICRRLRPSPASTWNSGKARPLRRAWRPAARARPAPACCFNPWRAARLAIA